MTHQGGGVYMLLYPDKEQIIIRVPYSVETKRLIGSIPCAKFDRWEWKIPQGNLKEAWEILRLNHGHLYPYLRGRFPNIDTQGITALLTETMLILRGPEKIASYILTCINTICGYEDVVEELQKGKGRTQRREFVTLAERISKTPKTLIIGFPPGLRSRIKTFLLSLGISVKETSSTTVPAPELNISQAPKYTARDYQIDIAKQVNEIRRATIVMPTGSGKTRTAGEIIRTLRLPTLFLTDSRLLLQQTTKSFEETLGTEVGRVGGGHFDIKPVTVATVQKIRSIFVKAGEMLDVKRLKEEVINHRGQTPKTDDPREQVLCLLANTRILIVDEAHTLGADAVYNVASLADPDYAYGLTATPQREDEKGIYTEAATGPLWRPVKESDLIERGYLLPVEVWVIPFHHARTYKGIALKDMYKVKEEAILNNDKRNDLLIRLAERTQKSHRTLLLVNEHEHAATLADKLRTSFITGSSKAVTQEEAIQNLKDRVINTLVATPLLEQGVDIPEAELLIDGVPRRSVRRIIQSAGRIRRPLPGKTKAYIVTIADIDNGMFEQQFERKYHILKQAGFKIKILSNV